MSMQELYHRCYKKTIDEGEYQLWCPVSQQDPELEMLHFKFSHLFKEGGIHTVTDFTSFFGLKSVRQERAVACMVGLGIADALGAST
jgi:hypothetical protein